MKKLPDLPHEKNEKNIKGALQISIGWLSVISSVIPLALKGFYLLV